MGTGCLFLWSNVLAVPGVKVTEEGMVVVMVPIEETIAQSCTCPASSLKVILAAFKEMEIWTVYQMEQSEHLTCMSLTCHMHVACMSHACHILAT